VRGPYAQAALQALVLAADSGVPTNLADRRYASAPLRQATFVHGTVEQAGHESSVLSWSLPVSALKIKLENPEAFITYVRKSNRRGDRRHPHEALQNKKVA
jgi:hypothetical protein